MSRHALCAALAALFATPAAAVDAPHGASSCADCHMPHHAQGATLTSVAGNANLCQSCHRPGGSADAEALVDADQAVPSGPGLPAGTLPGGTSHRWDSGPAGHVVAAATNTSGGKVLSGGAYAGRYPKGYTLTISAGGAVGVARFSWTATSPGGGSGADVLTGPSVPLDEGVSAAFVDGGSSSFVVGDRWYLLVRPDVSAPSTPALAARTESGRTTCSTCHDQHSQAAAPFDPAAPPSGAGRHFQRVANDADQMCKDCHGARNVAIASAGSHPVGVPVPAVAGYRTPTGLPLDTAASRVQCQTCHGVHGAASTDGTLLRLAGVNSVCVDCHTLADTSAGSHFDNASSGTAWPGGQYGSTFPAVTDPARRGTCTNCHAPHGWPDAAAPAQDYPHLLVEKLPELCFTCHDGAPASDQRAGFATALWVNAPAGASGNLNLNAHHDVYAADQARSGAVITCYGCHDPHQAKPAAKIRADPDPSDGRVPLAGRSWTGSDLMSEWCLDCHDGSFPPGVTAPSVPLANVRTAYLSTDAHGTQAGNPRLRAGYGWATGDVVPCLACHERGHGGTNLFQLRSTIYSKDGLTPVPSDGGGTVVALTDPASGNAAVNGYYWCNTCHTGSMGGNRSNCFQCHYHGGSRF